MRFTFQRKDVFFVIGTVCWVLGTQACKDPPNLYQRYPSPLHRYYSEPQIGAIETVGGVPESVDRNIIQMLANSRIHQRFSKRQSRDCGRNTEPWDEVHVEDRAMCNWHYVPKHNSSRYPNIVVEAESNCLECASGYEEGRAPISRCEPVYRSFPVLERTGCTRGIYQYAAAYVSVKVAFVCARPRMASALDIPEYANDLNFLNLL